MGRHRRHRRDDDDDDDDAAIRFYSDRLFTNPEALRHVRLSSPPPPSQLPGDDERRPRDARERPRRRSPSPPPRRRSPSPPPRRRSPSPPPRRRSPSPPPRQRSPSPPPRRRSPSPARRPSPSPPRRRSPSPPPRRRPPSAPRRRSPSPPPRRPSPSPPRRPSPSPPPRRRPPRRRSPSSRRPASPRHHRRTPPSPQHHHRPSPPPSRRRPPSPSPPIEAIPDARRGDRDQVAALLRELVDTEIKYVNDLKALSTFIIEPMVELAGDASTAIISVEQTRACFLDPAPIAVVHARLLILLGEAAAEHRTTAQRVSLVCQAFGETLNALHEPYTNYLAMFATSAHLLEALRRSRPALGVALEEIRKQTSLELGSMMILPVQRLPRYELFLDRLEKHTPGSRRVGKARSALGRMIADTNTAASTTAPLEQLQWNEFDGHINLVAATRSLIRRHDLRLLTPGTTAFWLIGGRSVIAVNVILCNDVVVFATKHSAGGGGLKLHSVLALAGAFITDSQDGGEYDHMIRIEGASSVTNKTSSAAIIFDDDDVKRTWLDDLRAVIDRLSSSSSDNDDPHLLQMTVAIDLTRV